MTRCVALLGSINVGGNRLKMNDLSAALRADGFANVVTVTASGNVLFDHPATDPAALAARIGAVMQRDFALDCLVIVGERAMLARAIADNPFHGDGEDRFVHSIFLDSQPAQDRFDALVAEHRARGGERLALGDHCLYLDYVHGVGVSSLTGAFLQRRLGCRGTARNMTSLKRILAKMDD